MKPRLILLALAALAATSQATILTFDAGLSDGAAMPQDYGDNVTATNMGAYSYGENGEGFTPNVIVEYKGGSGGLHYWGSGFSGTTGVLLNEVDGNGDTTFVLAAAAGNQVVLHSLLWTSYGGSDVPVTSIIIKNQDDTELYNSGSFGTLGTHGTIDVGAITGQILTVSADLSTAGYDNDSFGFDNIVFSEFALPTAPVITEQPAPAYSYEGDLVMFTVQAAASSGTVSYAWMKDSVPLADNETIAGSTYSRLVISPAQASDAGTYHVVCTDAQASTTSSVAVLSFDLPLPSTVSEPAGATVASGANTSLSVVATNTVSYQWLKENAPIAAATNATLQLNAVTQADSGIYAVQLTNARGSVVSGTARLTVTATSSFGEGVDNLNALMDGNWSSQTAFTFDGIDSARSAPTGDSQTSEAGATFIGPGELSFQWMVSSEKGYDYLRWDFDGSEMEKISGTTAWAEKTTFVPDHAHRISWRYTKDGSTTAGQDAGYVDQLVFTPYGLSSLGEAVDAPPVQIILGGGGNWYGQDNETFDGTDAARSPSGLGDNGSAWFETTVMGPGMVVFSAKTSCEVLDRLRLRVDGTSVYSISGERDWTTVTNWIDWGEHTLRWAYEKDYSGDYFQDAVWVDQISYTPVTRSSLSDAADAEALVWTTSGTNPWFGQDHFTDDGVDALQTGITGDHGESWIKTTVTGPGTLSFRWKTSSENSDHLRFYLNGIQKDSRSDVNEWATYSIEITNEVSSELMWKYTKDYSGGYYEDAGWIDQVVFTPQRDPVSLTVQSLHGSPEPSVGTNWMEYGTTGTCTVEQVTFGTTNYTPTGWTMTGNEPLSGTTNWFVGTLTNNAVLTWNWQTNYWLEIAFDGNGSVDLDSGFQAKGSEYTLTATPDAGWLFMGWAGDASGTNGAAVTMDAAKVVLAVFSDDADDDGLTNTEEAAAGSNPWKKDTDDDGFDDAFEVAQGLNVTNDSSAVVNYIGSHGSTFGIYPSNVVLNVAIGEMLLDVVGTEATLNLQLETSEDLQSWTNAGPVKVWSWPVDGDKQYFRVRSAGE